MTSALENEPLNSIEDLPKQSKILYGAITGGSTLEFFKVPCNLWKSFKMSLVYKIVLESFKVEIEVISWSVVSLLKSAIDS